ncbi:MAG: hypothetical protein IPG74_09560 [Flavobacteriales bacterium]|nr:hypothetical protein [Flavobacteriales bacterium]
MIDGDTMVVDTPKTSYERRWTKPEVTYESEVYSPYMRDAVRNGMPPIDTHSDEFGYYEDQNIGGGGHVYFKTATMLYNLKYVLGDSLFWHGMQHYFKQWKFCHPYDEDMRNSFTQATHADLTWFFDAWISTDKTVDYAVKGVKHNSRKGDRRIVFRRNGMQMPIDFKCWRATERPTTSTSRTHGSTNQRVPPCYPGGSAGMTCNGSTRPTWIYRAALPMYASIPAACSLIATH